MRVTATGILFSLLIFQLFFLSFFLFTQEKGRKVSHGLLGLFFLLMALNLLDVFLLMTGVYFPHPALAGCSPIRVGIDIHFVLWVLIFVAALVAFGITMGKLKRD